MSWVVDTCLIIDVLENDPVFGAASARLLDRLSKNGLTLCPVSYVELAPAFLGDRRRQDEFLTAVGIDYKETWDGSSTQSAHQAWNRQVGLRRTKKGARRPVADILIGAFASCRTGLLTRNPADFKTVFPSLDIVTP